MRGRSFLRLCCIFGLGIVIFNFYLTIYYSNPRAPSASTVIQLPRSSPFAVMMVATSRVQGLHKLEPPSVVAPPPKGTHFPSNRTKESCRPNASSRRCVVISESAYLSSLTIPGTRPNCCCSAPTSTWSGRRSLCYSDASCRSSARDARDAQWDSRTRSGSPNWCDCGPACCSCRPSSANCAGGGGTAS